MLAASALNGTFVGMLSGAQELMVSLLYCESYVALRIYSVHFVAAHTYSAVGRQPAVVVYSMSV